MAQIQVKPNVQRSRDDGRRPQSISAGFAAGKVSNVEKQQQDGDKSDEKIKAEVPQT